MRKPTITFLFWLIIISPVFSGILKQQNNTDSLKGQLLLHPEKDTIRAELLNKIGFESYTSDLEKTKEYADELITLSEEIKYPDGITKGFNLMGIYYDYTGDYTKALEFYTKSLQMAEEANSITGISAGLNNIGMINEILGNYPLALDHYQKSLKIDLQQKDYHGIANSYLNIGNVHENLHDNDKAMKYYQQSLNLSDSIGDDKLKAYSLLNIGYVYNTNSENNRARLFFQESLNISENNNQKEGVLLACLMIGIIDKEEMNHAKAKEYLNRALEISIELGSVSQERYCYFHKAEVAFNQKHYNESLSLLNLAYVDDNLSDENLRINCLEVYSQIYASRKDYENAYKHHVILKSLQDHSFNDKNIQKISKLEFQYKYDIDKKALEMEQQKKDALAIEEQKRQKVVNNSLIAISLMLSIILIIILVYIIQRRKANKLLIQQKQQLEEVNKLLLKQKEEIERVAAELGKANQTKDKFFSIIAHDLRSPFTTIMGFSDILLESHEEFDKESLETFLGKIKNGSEGALILLENLFSWARSNSGDITFSPKILDLEPIVTRICKLYESAASSKHISLKCEILPGSEIFADEEMLRTIIRNLMSNALKFTHMGGELKVSMSSNETHVLIHVIDNGMGMNQEQVDNLFELNKKIVTRGTSGEKGTGLGLTLCYEFVSKHGGKIDVESELGKGTEISVLLPKIAG